MARRRRYRRRGRRTDEWERRGKSVVEPQIKTKKKGQRRFIGRHTTPSLSPPAETRVLLFSFWNSRLSLNGGLRVVAVDAALSARKFRKSMLLRGRIEWPDDPAGTIHSSSTKSTPISCPSRLLIRPRWTKKAMQTQGEVDGVDFIDLSLSLSLSLYLSLESIESRRTVTPSTVIEFASRDH